MEDSNISKDLLQALGFSDGESPDQEKWETKAEKEVEELKASQQIAFEALGLSEDNISDYEEVWEVKRAKEIEMAQDEIKLVHSVLGLSIDELSVFEAEKWEKKLENNKEDLDLTEEVII